MNRSIDIACCSRVLYRSLVNEIRLGSGSTDVNRSIKQCILKVKLVVKL